MVRSITIDSIQLVGVQLVKDRNGDVHVHAQYHLMSGTQVIRTLTRELTDSMGASRRAAALAVVDGAIADVNALEVS